MRTGSPWTSEEDEKLSRILSVTGGYQWRTVGQSLERHPRECAWRWLELRVLGKAALPWSAEQDQRLSRAVSRFGEQRWALVAAAFHGLRTESECRDRWVKLGGKAAEIRPVQADAGDLVREEKDAERRELPDILSGTVEDVVERLDERIARGELDTGIPNLRRDPIYLEAENFIKRRKL